MPSAELDRGLSDHTQSESADSALESDHSSSTSTSEQSLNNRGPVSKKSLRPKRKNVRTGCLTCKIRKVKCDEERPECRRCKSTGRKCDGYAPPMSLRYQQKNQVVVATSHEYILPQAACSIYKVPANHPGLMLEAKTLDFVRLKTISALSGYFNSCFWSRLLSQPNNLEPTLWHAVLAVGSFHELNLTQGIASSLASHGTPSTPEMTFALYHYTEAINLLRENVNMESPPMSVVLTTCILFVYLEFLRGDFESASKQINSGLNIIKQSVHAPSSTIRGSTGIGSLVQQFNSLGILGTLLGQPPNYLEPAPPQPQALQTAASGFTSIAEARASILDIIAVLLPFVQITSATYRHARGEPPIALELKKLDLECQLDAWTLAFDRFTRRSRARKLAPASIRAAKVLRMQHAISSIWIAVTFASEETAFDAYTALFEEIVSLGEAVTGMSVGVDLSVDMSVGLDADVDAETDVDADEAIPTHAKPAQQQKQQQPQHPPSITFELGIIPPLYWSAVKCRDPLIRRRALHLLIHKTPRQEGLWFAKQAASVARKVIEVEEGCLLGGDGDSWTGPGPRLLDGRSDWTPPECARVRRGETSQEVNMLPSWFRIKDVQWTQLMTSTGNGSERGRYVTFEVPGRDAFGGLGGESRFTREYIKYLDWG